ncbi:MAG TPA: DUF3857 domain-containing protein [Bacteroidales bacterium]|nr:DUF3857 domain-containing protein [Bacteroidales bacterium]HRZ75732.1 DUF3857 domain-containing protein [Bacteroidales bacterium]
MKKNSSLWTGLALVLLTGCLMAQPQPGLLQEMRSAYPGARFIQLKQRSVYTIDVLKDKLDISLCQEEQLMYLDHIPYSDAKRSIYSTEFNQLVDHDLSVYNLDKGKYRKTRVTGYSEIVNTRERSFYDDIKEYSFFFPGVREGSVMEIKTEHRFTDPRLIFGPFLAERFPIHEFEVIFDMDEGVELEVFEKHFQATDIQRSTQHHKGRRIVTYTRRASPPMREETNSPPPRYYYPHLIPVIRSFRSGNERIDVLGDLHSLYSWYFSFIRDLEQDIDLAALRQLTDSLVRNSDPPRERMEKIYYWVQSHIKYIDFEYGMGGLVPRKPDQVLAQRYGDCKDNSGLLHVLLKLAGIPSYLSWTGSRDLPYSYDEISSPATDDHMIVTCLLDGDTFFLDPVTEYHHCTLPSRFTQGKQVLAAISHDSALILNIPVVSPSRNFIRDSVALTIDGTDLHGKGSLYARGYRKVALADILTRPQGPARQEALEGYLQKGNNKFVVEDVETGPLPSFSPDLQLGYRFNIGNYVHAIDDRLFIDLNLSRKMLPYKPVKDRQTPIELGSTLSDTLFITLEIPKGFHLQYLPPTMEFSGADFGYSLSYASEGNLIRARHAFRCSKLMIESMEIPAWAAFIASLEAAFKETIILQKDEK